MTAKNPKQRNRYERKRQRAKMHKNLKTDPRAGQRRYAK